MEIKVNGVRKSHSLHHNDGLHSVKKEWDESATIDKDWHVKLTKIDVESEEYFTALIDIFSNQGR